MDKTVSDTPPAKRHRGAGRVPFLANLDDIRLEVEKGWPLSAVYEHFQDKMDISYIQFTRYVNRYIHDKPLANKPSTLATVDSMEKPVLPKVETISEPGTFMMSDVVPNRDELI